MSGTGARKTEPATPPPIGPAVSVGGPALRLWELTRRLEARSWASEFLPGDGDDTVLRLRPPGAADGPGRTLDVVVRDRGHGPYFAYAKVPHRPIADVVDDPDRAVAALELVHGSEPSAALVVPEGLIKAAANWSETA